MGDITGPALATDVVAAETNRLLRKRGLRLSRVVDRRRSDRSSSAYTEIVRCELLDGSDLVLLNKYEPPRRSSGDGHWRGLAYEAAVYERVLAPHGAAAPQCFGLARDDDSGLEWLVLEYIDGGDGRSGALRDDGVVPAARWIAAFHRDEEARLAEPSRAFLQQFDSHFYGQWAERTVDAVGSGQQEELGWLEDACHLYHALAVPVLAASTTIVHGEFYRENILFRGGVVYPVDWESAAVGAGEIDLAALVEGWGPDIARACIDAYAATRWPDGETNGFEARVDAARLYLHFRWLGDRRPSAPSRWRLAEVEQVARRLQAQRALG